MPSFDIVSEIDKHELTNAIDQANREISNRFDFKGTNSKIEHKENTLKLVAPAEFQIKQMTDILQSKLSKRGIDVRCLDKGEVRESNNEARQEITVRQGIDKDLARTLVKKVKESRLKVQAAIQGEQVRVSSPSKDDLQAAMTILKSQDFGVELQFGNYR